MPGQFGNQNAKGHIPWNKGLHIRLNPKGEFHKGMEPWNKGVVTKLIDVLCVGCNKSFREYISDISAGNGKYCSRKCWNTNHTAWNKGKKLPHLSGPNASAWKGGISPLRNIAMKRPEYILWRTSVFERDDYTCQSCNKRGVQLHADHIKPWALYPDLRYAIDNGRALCVPCHRKTDTWGMRVFAKGGD